MEGWLRAGRFFSGTGVPRGYEVKDRSRLLGRVLVLAACITAMLAVPAFATGGAVKKGIYQVSNRTTAVQVFVKTKSVLYVTQISCKGNFYTPGDIYYRGSGNGKPPKIPINSGRFTFHFPWDKTQERGTIKGTFAGKVVHVTISKCGKMTLKFTP
jgi:hypothetical protein